MFRCANASGTEAESRAGLPQFYRTRAQPRIVRGAGVTDDRPLAIDLFCGLGGWTDGLLAEGYRVIGYDIEEHAYGEHRYQGELVIQDVLTVHGSAFKDAVLIVASPPCQEYSYMAMPWKLAKAKAAAIRADTTGAELERLNRLFNACFRIQKEASIAAGRHIPLIVENVRGAIPWVGRSRWHFGSFHLWGDVPALMPFAIDARKFNPDGTNHGQGSWFAIADSKNRGSKNNGGSWFNVAHNKGSGCGRNPVHALAGRKQPGISGPRNNGKGDRWFQDGAAQHGSKSSARKAASALIAKIPEPLARHIGRTFRT